jgi:hypothetical protein
MMFAALVVRDADVRIGSLTKVVAIAVALVLSGRTTATMVAMAPRTRLPALSGAAAYLRDHVPDAETVFHSDWDEFPLLFFTAPKLHYLVGLDPTFMLVTDRARGASTTISLRARGGRVRPDPPRVPLALRPRHRRRRGLPPRDAPRPAVPRGVPRTVSASVFELEEDDRPPLVWKSGARASRRPGSWTSLRSAERIGARRRDRRRGRGAFSLGIASDDEVRVFLDGREVYARSPLRTPRAGVPGGPPASLDDLDAAVPDAAERSVGVTLEGPARLAVEACRLGEDFGFFLRLSAE